MPAPPDALYDMTGVNLCARRVPDASRPCAVIAVFPIARDLPWLDSAWVVQGLAGGRLFRAPQTTQTRAMGAGLYRRRICVAAGCGYHRAALRLAGVDRTRADRCTCRRLARHARTGLVSRRPRRAARD